MPRSKMAPPASSGPSHLNLSVLVGRLTRPIEERSLPSGGRLASLEVTVERGDGERNEAVPVSWFDPPAELATFGTGMEVLIVGRVHRRFFRSGGRTQSRTDVAAEFVVPLARRSAVSRALARATELLASGPS